MSEFEMNDLDKTKLCPGLQLEHSPDGILVHQSAYTQKVLEIFGFDKACPSKILMAGRSLQPDKDPFRPKEEGEETLGLEVPYLSPVGALMYLANCTRPDIAFAVSLLARYNSEPTKIHCKGVKNIFRYLQGTKDLGLFYKRNQDLSIIGYADAGYLSNPQDCKSQTGYVFQEIVQKLMAEAILLAVSKIGTVVLNEIVSDVVQKLSRKLDALKELPAKVQRIEIELNTMNDIIQDLGSTNLNNNVIKGWIGNVRKLAYRVEDVIDKYSYEALKLKDEGFLHRYIITGSRHVKVEDLAALAQPKRRLVLQPLGSTESFKLFCSRAFHSNLNRECPMELKTVATKVVERCRGPLAIVSSGSLLSTKQPTEHAWNHMFNHLRSELRGDNHVQPILDLSYHDLPGNLRNCFLYCSLFPEDYAISRESLVRLWVAEGFAVKKENSTPEEVAEGNLMELIGRNMLEVVERDELLRVSTCKMHDLVRDLALAVAKEERFGSANDPKEMIRMDKEVRRFSTCGWTDSKAIVGVKFPRLRTIMSLATASPCTNMLSSVLSGSSYLTVLELQDSAITQVPASIGDLFNLRYIGLRRTNIQSLPHTIDKLSNLETLDIKQTKVEKLPPGIVNIEKLRHLLADRFADEKQTEFRYFVGVEAPHMISNFQELQTLETIHASKDLSLQLQTVWVDNINASNCDDLLKTLSDMPLLSSLLLSACDQNETLSFQALKPISTNLHRLSSAQYFRAMGRVSRCFPKLKTLVLKRMPNVKQLEIKKGAIPAIDGIYIVSLSKLNMVPHGIESLETLKKLWMLDLHKDFKAQWNLNQMHNKMKHVPELRV
ncbi:disease resistance protein RPM1-like [Triticum aestivum]|uniref:disease resistance protein RPM1-like n=1 Tax=Triticum aestivum TaxID=4565 RepID=UPI001D033C96|nr:disease resistance protein RPM1-like [Triticum aestivum]